MYLYVCIMSCVLWVIRFLAKQSNRKSKSLYLTMKCVTCIAFYLANKAEDKPQNDDMVCLILSSERILAWQSILLAHFRHIKLQLHWLRLQCKLVVVCSTNDVFAQCHHTYFNVLMHSNHLQGFTGLLLIFIFDLWHPPYSWNHNYWTKQLMFSPDS